MWVWGKDILLLKVEGERKVVPHVWLELDLEHVGCVADVALQDQGILVVGRVLPAKDGTVLERKLVGAKVIGLEEGELVLVRGVEQSRVILLDRQVESLYASRRVVETSVGGGHEFRAAEARLRIGCRWGEDGCVGDA